MHRIILRIVYFVSIAAVCQLADVGKVCAQPLPEAPEPQGQAPDEIEPSEDAIPMEVLMANARRPDLFYNYYAAPGVAGGNGAAMYPAPRPIPPSMGNVYYTYQAMMPHEWMYSHYREYYTPYGNWHGYGGCNGHGSVNRTVIRWQRGFDTRSTYLYRLFHRPRVPMIPCGNSGLGGAGCYCSPGR